MNRTPEGSMMWPAPRPPAPAAQVVVVEDDQDEVEEGNFNSLN